MDPEIANAQLIAEQLRHALDLLKAEIETVRQIQEHSKELADHRLKALEEQTRDHEQRIRAATDGVTQFKVWSGLAAGGSWIVSVFALIKSWFVP
jgi:hypothetical protein